MISLRAAIIAGVLLAAYSAGFMTEKLLRDAADDKRIAAEAEAEKDRLNAIRDRMDEQHDRAYAISQQAEAERQKIEVAYANAQAKLRKALSAASCPVGGRLADVPVPAAALAGLRDAAGQGGDAVAEPGADKPDR
jgi:hypothetical protein